MSAIVKETHAMGRSIFGLRQLHSNRNLTVHSLFFTWVVTRLAAAFTIVLSGMVIAGMTSAHGGGTLQLSSAPSGPYWFTVWTSPEPVRVDELHVTIGVGSADGAPVLDAYVEVEITGLSSDGMVLGGVATTEQSANKFLYEVDFQLPEPGLYMVTVNVSGADGYGSVHFELKVLSGESYDWVGVMLVSGSVAVLVAWLVLRRRVDIEV